MANGQFGFTADIPGAVQRGLQFRQAEQLRPLQQQQAQLGLQQQQQQLQTGGLQQQNIQQQMDQRTEDQKNKSLVNTALQVSMSSDENIIPILEKQISTVQSQGGDPTESIRALELAKAGNFAEVKKGAQNLVDIGVRQGIISAQQPVGTAMPAETVAFNELMQGFTLEQKKAAREIKAGLKGRAMSNAVLSAIQSGDVTNLAQAKAEIKQAEKFGEMTGSSRAKIIDKGFESINKINKAIGNIDNAIAALDKGAGVGAIEKMFPSIRAASVELENIRGQMALDVVGATTFGALSKGELDLAKDVALPTGLNTDELKDFLTKKRDAQNKLRAYYNEQIDFLDQGGTVAGFLRMKKKGIGQQSVTPQQEQQAQLNKLSVGNMSDEELFK